MQRERSGGGQTAFKTLLVIYNLPFSSFLLDTSGCLNTKFKVSGHFKVPGARGPAMCHISIFPFYGVNFVYVHVCSFFHDQQ
ncbi:hypothetical protein DFH27DRAFT_586407 [Peziza echinospora]|nr:hypothetical protein DFH27DRAFT_586407 [Peziza echinospora]